MECEYVSSLKLLATCPALESYGLPLAPTYGCRMFGELTMGKYHEGDHVKFEVKDEESGEVEWIWLLVDHSDDEQQLVFGQLDSEPVVTTSMKRGQLLAVSYQQVRDHKKPSEF